MFTTMLFLCFASLPYLGFAGSVREAFIVHRGSKLADGIVERLGHQASDDSGILQQANKDSDTPPGTNGSEAATTTSWNGGHNMSWFGCEDKAPEHTGFEVHTEDGFLSFASCEELKGKCLNWVHSKTVRQVCPITCFICDPNPKNPDEAPPCYDAIETGIRFKLGPQATCLDLANYCNHSTLWYHVQAACRMTCGLCEAHVGLVAGKCHDAESHDAPEYVLAGHRATCGELIDFCDNSPDSYVIRHKCPRTCGACPDQQVTTTQSSFTTSNAVSYDAGNDNGNCGRRRRWGHCSTRRRRNL
jgi:hypothetical protein